MYILTCNSCRLPHRCHISFRIVWYHFLIFSEQEFHLLAAVTRLKSQLSELIEPDFGLLDQLFSLKVLTNRQFASIRSKPTVFERNDAVLDLLKSEDGCCTLLTALQRTYQQHIINVITQNESKTDNDFNSRCFAKSGSGTCCGNVCLFLCVCQLSFPPLM